jgi:hypothetical protein
MEIVNRVAESAIETLDLAAFAEPDAVVPFDLAPYLHMGLVLRERDFRDEMKAYDWSAYTDRHVAVFCSADALVPTWAFMLVAARLHGVAASTTAARPEEVRRARFARALDAHDWSAYAGKPVVLKGCGSDAVPLDGYVRATQALQAVASKVMYGEACSSVPVWRRPAAPAAGGPRVSAGVRPAGPPPRS